MTDDFAVGTRVRVRRDPDFGPGPWPAEPTGTVINFADETMTLRGAQQTYVIEFDTPQIDADGDGPYVMAHVTHDYLEPLS